MAYLRCVKSAHEKLPDRIPLLKELTKVGRETNCDIRLTWDGISRNHCSILGSLPSGSSIPTSWLVEGSASGNGVFVNHVRVTKSRLRPGDLLGFGRGAHLPEGAVIAEGHLDYVFQMEVLQPHKGLAQTGKPKDERSAGASSSEPQPGFKYRNCVSYVYPPSGFRESKRDGDAPSTQLELDFVHGYRGTDCRNNLHWLPNGDILFNTAALAVRMNLQRREQQYFTHHDDDVLCVAVHPTLPIAASGQVASFANKVPPIYVWDTSTTPFTLIRKIQDMHARRVSSVTFTSRGDHILSVGGDDTRAVAMHDWRSGKLVCFMNGGGQDVFAIAAHPSADAFVTCGERHLKFWMPESGPAGGTYKAHLAAQATTASGQQTVRCVCFLPSGLCAAGMEDGCIVAWGQRQKGGAFEMQKRIEKAHAGPVTVRARSFGFQSFCCMFSSFFVFISGACLLQRGSLQQWL
jgi:hypothetical protein